MTNKNETTKTKKRGPKKGEGGRTPKPKTPTKADSEKIGGVLALIDLGYKVKKALELTGVPESTFYDLLNRYKTFAEEYSRVFNSGNQEARQALKASLTERIITETKRNPDTGEYEEITKVIPPNLQSAKWWLENMESDEVYSKQVVETETKDEVDTRREEARKRLALWRQPQPTTENEPSELNDSEEN